MATRTDILHDLRTAGTWISGSRIGERFSISRAAVSKHVRALMAAGYDIESAPRRGYRYRAASNRLLAAEVQRLLKTATLGQNKYYHYNTIGSTHVTARQIAEKGCPEGSLVVAEMQSSGRGRKNRDWISPAESGIYATLVLRPLIPLEDTPLLTLAAAVAASEAVTATTALTPTIKWPNDILVNGHKVAGILTEVSSDIDRVEFALIGIGINVNTPLTDLPARPLFPASSLAIESGAPQSRAPILAHWLNHLESAYTRLIIGDRSTLLQRWKALAGIIGKTATIQRVHDTVHGVIDDLDTDGALLLRTPDGTLERILSGDITFVA